jgi:hypothetical protein
MSTFRLRPAEAKTAVMEINITPTLVFNPDTYDKIAYFVDQCKVNECQWFSTIKRTTLNNTSAIYLVEDVFIPEQAVDGTNVETTDQEMMAMWKDIRASRNLSDADFNILLKSGLIWGHSHVDMPPSPSKTDDEKWTKIVDAANRRAERGTGKEPVAMIIFNRSMKLTNRIYDPDLGIKWANVEVWIEDPTDYTYIETALKTKIRKMAPPAAATSSTVNMPTNLYRGPATVIPATPSSASSVLTTQPMTVLAGNESTIVFRWDGKKKL